MTKEEVDLIYEYLHENYEYRDGEFFSKIRNRIVGHMDKKKGTLSLTLNKKIIGRIVLISIAKCVFIYHLKSLPKYVNHINKNSMDNKIENLREAVNRKSTICHQNTKGVSTSKGKYRVSFSIGQGKAKSIGSWTEEKDAKDFYKKVVDLINNGDTIEQAIKEILLSLPTDQIKNKKYPKCVHKVGRKFVAAFYVNKRKIYVGTYKTPEEAHEAYLKAKEEYITNE